MPLYILLIVGKSHKKNITAPAVLADFNIADKLWKLLDVSVWFTAYFHPRNRAQNWLQLSKKYPNLTE